MDVRGLILDLTGTLYEGDEPVPGAPEALQKLLDAGIVVRCATNVTRRPRREVTEWLQDIGFYVEEAWVFTPAVAAATLLRGRQCHALVADGLLEDLGDIEVVDESPEYVLVGDLLDGFTYERLNPAFQHLMEGAGLVALQKNRYWQPEGSSGRPSLDAGAFVAALEYASGKAATVVGKPETPFSEAALSDLGFSAGEVAVVGDDPEADVGGARAAGLRSFQVKTGKYHPGAAGANASPDLLLDSFAELPGALGL